MVVWIYSVSSHNYTHVVCINSLNNDHIINYISSSDHINNTSLNCEHPHQNQLTDEHHQQQHQLSHQSLQPRYKGQQHCESTPDEWNYAEALVALFCEPEAKIEQNLTGQTELK